MVDTWQGQGHEQLGNWEWVECWGFPEQTGEWVRRNGACEFLGSPRRRSFEAPPLFRGSALPRRTSNRPAQTRTFTTHTHTDLNVEDLYSLACVATCLTPDMPY